MPVLMSVADLLIDDNTKAPVVVLQDASGRVKLPIFIGLMEASAIAAVREGIELPRPMTHDLLAALLEGLDGTLEKVEITALRERTFYALLHVRKDDAMRLIDCRPSDGLALALRVGAPISVSEDVIAEAGVYDSPSEEERYKDLLEQLDPDDFGKYEM